MNNNKMLNLNYLSQMNLNIKINKVKWTYVPKMCQKSDKCILRPTMDIIP